MKEILQEIDSMVINVTRKFAFNIALVFTFGVLSSTVLYAKTPTGKWVGLVN